MAENGNSRKTCVVPNDEQVGELNIDEIEKLPDEIEDTDEFILCLIEPEPQQDDPNKDPQPVPVSKCSICLEKCTPTCPPPVCGLLKEQLIVFIVMSIIALVGFLGYWFGQDY